MLYKITDKLMFPFPLLGYIKLVTFRLNQGYIDIHFITVNKSTYHMRWNHKKINESSAVDDKMFLESNLT